MIPPRSPFARRIPLSLRHWLLLGSLVCLPGLGAGCRRRDTERPLPVDKEAQLRDAARQVQGRLVYERNREGRNLGIFRIDLEQPPRYHQLTGEGQGPRWSPDGQWIAFRRGDELLRVAWDGSKLEKLARFQGLKALAWRTDGREIWCADFRGVHAYVLAEGRVRQAMGQRALELDVSADGTRVVYAMADHMIHGADLGTGTAWKIGRGCSASLSPEETRVTDNRGDHKQLFVRDWKSGEHIATLDAPHGTTFDNQWWSNHPDWIVSRTEQRHNQDIWLHRVGDNLHWKVTFTGDCDRPDFYARSSTPAPAPTPREAPTTAKSRM